MTMDQTTDGPAEPPDLAAYRTLGVLLAEAEQRYGVPPQAVEEKAALEARRAAEQIVLGAEAQLGSALTTPATRWIEGKMETPGVRYFEYEYTLRLAVPFGRGADALPPVRAYWSSRGMDVVPEEDSPAGDVVASPGKGEWRLRAGVLDPVTVFVRVASGRVLTSSSPPGNEREA
jgi:hypothetical protein